MNETDANKNDNNRKKIKLNKSISVNQKITFECFDIK